VQPFVLIAGELGSDDYLFTHGDATLRIRFVPEPAPLLLVVGGLVSLGVLHLRRRQ
jgi:hypothetical protein